MAVILKTGLTLTKLVNALWTPDASSGGTMKLVTELEAAGYTLKVSPSHLTVVYTNEENNEYGASQCDVKADTLALAVQGKVGYTVKVALRQKINLLIDSAHQWHQQHGEAHKKVGPPYEGDGSEFQVELMYDYNKSHSKIAAIKALRNLTGWTLKKSKDTVDGWVVELEGFVSVIDDLKAEEQMEAEAFSVSASNEKMVAYSDNPIYCSTNNDPVSLADAEHLHQPVHGTSTGSRYYAVALGDDVKVAVRIKNRNDISIRAVCNKHPNSKEGQAAKAGFLRACLQKSEQTGAKHWSLHLKPEGDDFVMAHRCIGSTLAAMGLQFYAVSGYLVGLQEK